MVRMNTNLAYKEEPREEILGGTPVMMAPASTSHNRVKGNLYHGFRLYLKDRTCEVLPDGEAVYLTEEDVFIPDVMIVCDPNKIQADGVHGAPDLVVEVLSPGTARYDKGYKKDVYERCGVREYWLVSPADKMIDQYILREGRFVLHDTYALLPDWTLRRMEQEERASVVMEFQCSLYDDLIIRLEDVFYRVP